ncbi:hypothetical protein FOL47_004007 [Perkinsus chesapeaki]|uniref:Uncharacterized protein n=1 Tax=Perkinsus chesapeaki TaxID=330153 RepID=A0A7J6M4W5_PERCH|nr:hypothetical protein FOL47_004007 [Perkinsus chesapeaki]
MESLENLHPAQSSKHSRGKKRSEKKRDSSKRSPSLRIVRDQAMLGLVPSFEHGLATESKYSTKPAREKSDVEAWRERWRRTQAALKLQAIFRGKIVRKIVDVKNKRLRRFRILMLCAARAKILAWNVRRKIAATRRMQAIHRGNQVRNKVSEMLANRLRSALILVQRVWRKRRAAVKIQSRFRGWRDWIRLREIIAGEGTRQFVVRQNRDIVLKGLWGGGEMRVRFPVGTCCLVSISSGMWRLHKDGEARPVGELKLRGAGRVYSSSLSVISVLPPVASRSKIGPFSQEKFLSVECALSSGASDALTLGNRVFSVSTKAKKLVMSDASGVDRREYVLPSVHGYVRIFMEVLSKSVVRLSLQWAGTRWLVVRQRVTGWENPRNFKLSGGAKLSPACPVIPVEVVREQFPDGLKKSLPDVAMVRSEKADASRRNVAPRPEEEEVYTINSTESMSSRDNRRSKRSVILTRPSRLSEKTPARNSTPADAIISAAGVFRNSVEQIFGARQEIGDNTSYSSSSVSSITSLSNSVRGRRAAMRGVSSLISCRGNRTSLTAETDELTCNDPCGSTWAITTEPLQEQQGREIYMSFKISVRGAQTYPTDDGHHGMFGIGFTTNDEIDEIPKKKSVCLFGYNFSSPTAESRRKSLAGQSRIRYTTFYDGREWKKLEDSLLPKVNDEVELVIMGDRVCVLVNDWAVFISDELDPSLLRRMRTQRIYGIVDLCGGPVYDVACELNTEVEATVLRALKAKEPTRSGRDYRFWRSQSVKAMADLERARGDEMGRILNAHTKKYGSLRAFIHNRMIERYLHNNEISIEQEAKRQKALNVVARIKEKRLAEHNLDGIRRHAKAYSALLVLPARRAATEESLRHLSKMNQAYFPHERKLSGGRQTACDVLGTTRAVDRANSLHKADTLKKKCIPRPRTTLTLSHSNSSDGEATNLRMIYERAPAYGNDPDAAIRNALGDYRPMTVGVVADAEQALSRARGFRGEVERFITAGEAKLQSRSATMHRNSRSPLQRSSSVTTRKPSLPAPFTTDMLLRPLLYAIRKRALRVNNVFSCADTILEALRNTPLRYVKTFKGCLWELCERHFICDSFHVW